MVTMNNQPQYLPQINTPLNFIEEKCNEMGVDYDYQYVDPERLKPSQGLIFMEQDYDESEDMPPIVMSSDDKIIDGHKRYSDRVSKGIPIKAFRLMQPHHLAIKTLNKIQDEYESIQPNNLAEKLDTIIKQNNAQEKSKIYKVYRKNDVNNQSKIGNYFTFNRSSEEDKEYQIPLSNVLDFSRMNIKMDERETPLSALYKLWFNNLEINKSLPNFNSDEPNYEMKLKTLAVVDKAKGMGYKALKLSKNIILVF